MSHTPTDLVDHHSTSQLPWHRANRCRFVNWRRASAGGAFRWAAGAPPAHPKGMRRTAFDMEPVCCCWWGGHAETNGGSNLGRENEDKQTKHTCVRSKWFSEWMVFLRLEKCKAFRFVRGGWGTTRSQLPGLPQSQPETNGCSNMAIEILYIGNGWDWGNIHFFLVGTGVPNWVELLSA